MPVMDVTPRELRDIDIRERFGGYHRDDVDDLLERAAARIEGLEGQLREAQTRVDSGEADAGKTRETEDMLHRTLLLAQRAADEAVAEAQSKARQILDDAETKARSTIDEAATTARRQAETERRRLETEVVELGAKRDALTADVDALERFETEYRARLRRSVESDLEMLSSKGSVAPSPRPTTHDVEMPTAVKTAATTEVTVAAPEPVATLAPVPPPAFGLAASEPPISAPSAASPPATSSPIAGSGTGRPASGFADAPPVATPPVAPSLLAPAPVSSFPPAASPVGAAPEVSAEPPWEEIAASPSTARPPLFDSEPEPEHLDDDAFFASLREAVTDETPLGPRDSASGADGFDPDDSRGGLFRRRGR